MEVLSLSWVRVSFFPPSGGMLEDFEVGNHENLDGGALGFQNKCAKVSMDVGRGLDLVKQQKKEKRPNYKRPSFHKNIKMDLVPIDHNTLFLVLLTLPMI